MPFQIQVCINIDFVTFRCWGLTFIFYQRRVASPITYANGQIKMEVLRLKFI